MPPKSIPFWDSVDIKGPDDCWVWKGSRDGNGYGMKKWNGAIQRTHRIAYQMTHGVILSRERPTRGCVLVRHSCDNPPCCNPAHLSPGNHADNRMDCVARNRHNAPTGEMPASQKQSMLRGEAHYAAVLTANDVLEIRTRLKAGATPTVLGREYGVSRKAIYQIKTGRTWAHI